MSLGEPSKDNEIMIFLDTPSKDNEVMIFFADKPSKDN